MKEGIAKENGEVIFRRSLRPGSIKKKNKIPGLPMNTYRNAEQVLSHLKIPEVRKRDLIMLRLSILVGVFMICQFLFWFFDPDNIGSSSLYWLLALSLGYKLLHLGYEWFYIASVKMPEKRESTRTWTVDMLTTYVPGEPRRMVVETLKAMVNVKYPHTTILCDEGNDPYLKEVCEELGVVHVYRGPDKKGAKAGNINYALEHHATGEICVILDPDHIPAPDFLHRVLPYFEDEHVGFVQSIQGYSNHDESFVAKGAAEQTYLFYGPIMMGMHRHGTVQSIGANCAFRREALDSIGGHAAGLCEDMHTSMRLHAKKWTSVYIPELLARGKTPSTISAFYKQQLKWSRGSFELLFEVYPKLFRKFTWPQRIHYFLTPLYFLYGIIGLIDLGIPIYSLLNFQVPLYIEFHEFLLRIIPVLIMITIIRHFSQNYLLEHRETGLHFAGGVLRVGTWWIYLLGLIFSVLRVRIPYIPTPKKSGLQNEWGYSLPNIVVLSVTFFAIVYGLKKDLTPYSWIMAGFAGINIVLLGTVVLAGQRKLIKDVSVLLKKFRPSNILAWSHRIGNRYVYSLIRNFYFTLAVTLLGFAFILINLLFGGFRINSIDRPPVVEKKNNWILLDDGNAAEPQFQLSMGLLTKTDTPPAIAPSAAFRVAGLGEEATAGFSAVLSHCSAHSLIPLIYWEVQQNALAPSVFGEQPASELQKELEVDLSHLAEQIGAFRQPVILYLDIKSKDTAAANEESSNVQVLSLLDMIKNKGASNMVIAWEYRPGEIIEIPRDNFIDLLIVPLTEKEELLTLSEFIKDSIDLPFVMFSDQEPPPGLREEVTRRLLNADKLAFGWITSFSVPDIDFEFAKSAVVSRSPALPDTNVSIYFDEEQQQYQWMVDGDPFYVKGVVYNPQHDWRDGNWPLTRRQLQRDFSLIKAMGANTVSRISPSTYDYNILTLAEENELKVLYGFWCDPDIDYFSDQAKAEALKKKIIDKVRKYRNHPALLAWVFTNSVWTELDHFFYQPYLTKVRMAYTEWLDQLACEIKQLDPERPVIVSVNGGWDLSTNSANLRYHAASCVDVVAVNAYYEEHLHDLHTVVRQLFPDRPYIVNAFGPKEGWKPDYTRRQGKRILEPGSFEKARMYSRIWSRYIEKNRKYNLGGSAYCWRDRREGTAVLSGLIDYKGRLKPAYYALKQVWTGEEQHFPLGDVLLKNEAVFQNGEFILSYSAITTNNQNPQLTYEWYICRDEYLDRVENLTINYSKLGQWGYKLLRKYRQHISKEIIPQNNGAIIHYPADRADAMQRVYLHIYDDQGNVVTTSLPVFSN
jgi:cellulose synthase (UDP-forming)